MKTAIENVRLVTPQGISDSSSVTFENGRITEVLCGSDSASADKRIDGGGAYLSAGFIDIHVHGGGGYDFMDGTEAAFRGAMAAHMTHGTTAIVPTTLCADEKELSEVFEVSRRIRAAADPSLPEALGLHLEGPFVDPAMAGAQDPQYIKVPSDMSWRRIADSAQGEILIWTVAPELPGALDMCRALRSSGIIFSAGHSSARYPDVVSAIDAGYTMATHIYSSMSTIIRERGFRVPGLLEGALLHDELCAEVIADGLHLPPELLKLIYKTKGAGRMVLITDAMRGAGMPDGQYMLGSLRRGQEVSVFNGIAHMPDGISFAGSVATADRLIRTMVKRAGIPLAEAVAMMTENPAREIRISDRKGSVAPGYDADLVLFDDDIGIRSVWCRGERTV